MNFDEVEETNDNTKRTMSYFENGYLFRHKASGIIAKIDTIYVDGDGVSYYLINSIAYTHNGVLQNYTPVKKVIS